MACRFKQQRADEGVEDVISKKNAQRKKTEIVDKQFGKLNRSEIKFAVDTHEKYTKLVAAALPKALNSEIAKRIESEVGQITWAWVYDLPYTAALSLVVAVLGLDADLSEAAKTENPTSAALHIVASRLQEEDAVFPEGISMDALRMELMAAWHFNDQAIRHYSLSINELLAKGDAGNDQALLSAVSIDPCAAGAMVLLRRLGRAKILGKGGFLKKYRAALKGPHVSRWIFKNLRWTDFLLRDIDANSTATVDEVFDLVAGTLEQYSRSGKDPVRGLQSRRDAWKKEATS